MAVINRTRLGLKLTRPEKHPLTRITSEYTLNKTSKKRVIMLIFLKTPHLLVVKKYNETYIILKEASIGLTIDVSIM
jgi:hypothetical protein